MINHGIINIIISQMKRILVDSRRLNSIFSGNFHHPASAGKDEMEIILIVQDAILQAVILTRLFADYKITLKLILTQSKLRNFKMLAALNVDGDIIILSKTACNERSRKAAT